MPTILLVFSVLSGLTVLGALDLVSGSVLFALLAAPIDLYDREYSLSRNE